jgi:hypothetical protein
MSTHKTLTIAIVAFALALTSTALAERPGTSESPVGKPCKPFRPNQPPAGTKPSFAMPKLQRPSAQLTTWGVQTAWQEVQYRVGRSQDYNRDPYTAAMTGYNEGSKVTLALQTKSEKVAIPESCPGCTQTPPKQGKLSPERWAKKQRSQAWQKAVAEAQRWERLETFTTTVPSHAQTQTEQRANELPTHTPYKLTGKDPFNRTYAKLQGNVAGLATRNDGQVSRPAGGGYTQYGSVTSSGLHVPACDVGANTNAQNLFITPAYQLADGKVQAKILGLAAFPAGSKITVTNLRKQGAGEADHTVSFVASKSGSGRTIISGLQRDMLQVTVSFDGVANQAHAASHSFNVRIPKASGKPAFKARGIVYYAAGLGE